MKPFTDYPDGGRRLLGRVKGDVCRRGYGLRFIEVTGQHACGYCGLEMLAVYQSWLNMALDHVVPASHSRRIGLPYEWTDDASSKVLSCAACNTFGNRYQPPTAFGTPTSLEEYFDYRDRVFADRRSRIQKRHEEDRAFHRITVDRLSATAM